MLSVPHMIVVFIVVLVVFGPQKLPELARSFGKLMAEFRKASGDFRSAFEEEMRDLERQARVAELKKQAAESIAAAEAITAGTAAADATLASPAGTESLPAPLAGEARITESPVIVPATDSVPRLDVSLNETAQATTQDRSFPVDEAPAEAYPNGSSAPATKSPNPKPSLS
jgi:sec-independent protein translocase protein TatA